MLFDKALHGYVLAYYTGLYSFVYIAHFFCYVIPLESDKRLFFPPELLMPGTISLPLSIVKSLNCFPGTLTRSIIHWMETWN